MESSYTIEFSQLYCESMTEDRLDTFMDAWRVWERGYHTFEGAEQQMQSLKEEYGFLEFRVVEYVNNKDRDNRK